MNATQLRFVNFVVVLIVALAVSGCATDAKIRRVLGEQAESENVGPSQTVEKGAVNLSTCYNDGLAKTQRLHTIFRTQGWNGQTLTDFQRGRISVYAETAGRELGRAAALSVQALTAETGAQIKAHVDAGSAALAEWDKILFEMGPTTEDMEKGGSEDGGR